MPRFARFAPVFCALWGLAASADDFGIVSNDRGLTLNERERPLLEFVHTPAPVSGDEVTPGNYIHPLYGLSGEVVTGESPTVWGGASGIHWGWTGLGVAGQLINIEDGSGGRRSFERWTGADTPPDHATFGVQSAWVLDADGRARVLENLTVTAFPVDGTSRKIDIAVLIRNISDAKIMLEGGLPGSGLSVTLNPERTDWALADSSGWVKTGTPYMSPWTVCTYRDDRRSTRSGLAILQDSRNPAFSTPNWLLEEGARVTVGTPDAYKMELKPGEFLEFRYRIILFRVIGGGPNMTSEYSKFMSPVAPGN